jgi:hypothetical protein
LFDMGVGLEMIQKLIVTLFVLVAVTLAWSASPARELARLLAEKGLISQSDLSRVEQVDAEQSVRLLTSILQKKGLINGTEAARVQSGAEALPVATAVSSQPVAAGARPARDDSAVFFFCSHDPYVVIR